MKKTILFTSKKNKYLEINLTKEVKDLYSKNYRMLMTETEDMANGYQMGRYPVFLDWKN